MKTVIRGNSNILLIDLLRKAIITKAKDNIDIRMIDNAIYYILSCAINIATKKKYKRYNCHQERIINFFGITFAGTGEGKDFVFDLTLKQFHNLDKHYNKMLHKKFNKIVSSVTDCGLDFKVPNYALPSGIMTSIDGTPEGFQKIMQGMAYASNFSLNISHSEIGDIIMSVDMLSRIKEAWDSGRGKGKTIAGGGYFDVDNIPVNVFLYGTPYSIKSNPIKIEKMKSELINGFGRRSFVFYSKPKEILPNEDFGYITNDEQKQLEEITYEFMKTVSNNEIVLEITKEANKLLDDYVAILKDEYNQDIQNELKRSLATSFIKIERLSAIIAIADFATAIEPKHMQLAIDFNENTKQSILDISMGYQPHALIFDYLSSRTMSRVELIQEIQILNSKNFLDYMSLANEYALHLDYTIKEVQGTVKSYRAEPLSKTDINKIIVSVALDGHKKEQAIHFKPMKLPFFGKDKKSIESLVTSDVGSISFSHFNGSDLAPNGHRKADNFIQGQNCIAIDVDRDLALDDALILLQDYTYIIYTTKSHRVGDNGDRYRIILPTYKEFYVDAEKHKEVIKNACNLIGIESFDASTRNVSRLWYTNENATVYTNIGKMFDVTSCIPNTEPNKRMTKALEPLDSFELEARVKGVFAWFLDSTDTGNRNTNLFRAGKLLQDLGEDFGSLVLQLNSLLDEPLSQKEVNTIILSVRNGVKK